MPILLRFTPPYTNRPKDVPCCDVREAEQLKAWLQGTATMDLHVQILSTSTVEAVLG